MISKKRSGILAATLLSVFTASTALAQNVAINTDGTKANPNAILDIKSADKGLLIPRITSEARMRIAPTQGLMVYDINTDSFWYNTGRRWINLEPALASAKIADSAWALLGNAGTVDNVNFLGTTDNVPLNIRVNNFPSGRIDPVLFNTFLGYRSGFLGPVGPTGHDNTGLGAHALFHLTTGFNNTGIGSNALMSNTTGWHNTALGRLCLQANTTGFNNTGVGTSVMVFSSTGTNNTAIGSAAMFANMTGSRNSALGVEALWNNFTGVQNTAIGYQALRANINSNNTAVGAFALAQNTSGMINTALGEGSMFDNSSGSSNTAVGVGSLDNNTSGTANTAVGINALTSNLTGTNNTAIGFRANVSAGNLTNATALGFDAISNASNKVRIGNGAVTVIEGQVPFTSPSDGRFKFGVEEDVKGLDFIMQLRPVTYQFDVKRFDAQLGIPENQMGANYNEAILLRRSGFIAQEVEQAALKAGYNFSGIITPKSADQHYSLSYESFVVPLVKAVQEQQQVIDDQRTSITEQDKKIAEQDKKISEQDKTADLQRQLEEIKKLLANLK